MFIIFDLDGTLVNIEHRLHHIDKTKGKPNWDAFHQACVDDVPIQPIIEIFQSLKRDGHYIEIWSGRSDAVREQTMACLSQNYLYPDKLLMRMAGDYTPDHELKQMWLNQAAEAGMVPDLVFDDRSRLVEMWRRNGIRCCQVAEGDF
jgi:hypothetical protein